MVRKHTQYPSENKNSKQNSQNSNKSKDKSIQDKNLDYNLTKQEEVQNQTQLEKPALNQESSENYHKNSQFSIENQNNTLTKQQIEQNKQDDDKDNTNQNIEYQNIQHQSQQREEENDKIQEESSQNQISNKKNEQIVNTQNSNNQQSFQTKNENDQIQISQNQTQKSQEIIQEQNKLSQNLLQKISPTLQKIQTQTQVSQNFSQKNQQQNKSKIPSQYNSIPDQNQNFSNEQQSNQAQNSNNNIQIFENQLQTKSDSMNSSLNSDKTYNFMPDLTQQNQKSSQQQLNDQQIDENKEVQLQKSQQNQLQQEQYEQQELQEQQQQIQYQQEQEQIDFEKIKQNLIQEERKKLNLQTYSQEYFSQQSLVPLFRQQALNSQQNVKNKNINININKDKNDIDNKNINKLQTEQQNQIEEEEIIQEKKPIKSQKQNKYAFKNSNLSAKKAQFIGIKQGLQGTKTFLMQKIQQNKDKPENQTQIKEIPYFNLNQVQDEQAKNFELDFSRQLFSDLYHEMLEKQQSEKNIQSRTGPDETINFLVQQLDKKKASIFEKSGNNYLNKLKQNQFFQTPEKRDKKSKERLKNQYFNPLYINRQNKNEPDNLLDQDDDNYQNQIRNSLESSLISEFSPQKQQMQNYQKLIQQYSTDKKQKQLELEKQLYLIAEKEKLELKLRQELQTQQIFQQIKTDDNQNSDSECLITYVKQAKNVQQQKSRKKQIIQMNQITPENSDEENLENFKQNVGKFTYQVRSGLENKQFGNFNKDAPDYISKHKINHKLLQNLLSNNSKINNILKIQYYFYKVEWKRRPSGLKPEGNYYSYLELKQSCPRLLLEYLEKMSQLLR
ncbi:hypothetical protein PPERSA_02231 [Pseudocohnilembus persalinus]|uniref:Uncharacterized protein n=1 Tax=Pseudocohnilembus persalinus TaxID=266149 RepID=A0A0V0QLA9_PSEPJ|nr:hypothetical protein PPERSA_02231 [Pseudocohnilembus persalinus]|eukprot:KRX02741.1 hypothetical protein PPERSA_02231 [Pseudocohnilembus persalinus]